MFESLRINQVYFFTGDHSNLKFYGVYCLVPLEYWNHGLESHLGSRCMSVLSCEGRCLARDPSRVQRSLSNVYGRTGYAALTVETMKD
jgi:hypothetical protein